MRTLHALLLFIPLLLLTASCEQIAELTGDLTMDAPEVTYSKTTFEADFYQAGSSSAPSIDWNGDQGTITLGSTIEGLDINTSTGKLEWTKLLPPGTHEVDVIVANGEGQVVVPVTIENLPVGTFTGDDTLNYYWSITFMKDGTATLLLNDKNNPDPASATYELTGNDLEAAASYDDSASVFAITGTFMQSASKAVFEGEWYNGRTVDPGNVGATFSLELE